MFRRVFHLPNLFDELEERTVPFWHYAAVIATVLFTFNGILRQVEFLADDWAFFHQASLSWSNVFKPAGETHYSPIILGYFRVLVLLFGFNPLPFGAMALVLHSANCCLLLRLARRLGCTSSVALSVALVYATHYLIFEAVFWLTCSSWLLMIFFYLLTVNLYLWAMKPEGSPLRFILPWLAATLCLFTFEAGMSVFLLCVVLDFLRRYSIQSNSRSLKIYVPALGRAALLTIPVLSMFVLKTQLGGRFTMNEGIQLSATPQLLATYALQTWFPSQKLSSFFANDPSVPFDSPIINMANGSPVQLVGVVAAFVLLPVIAILWKGTSTQKIGLLWFLMAAGSMSLGTSGIASRYFVVSGLPGAWLLVTCVAGMISWAMKSTQKLEISPNAGVPFGAFVVIVIATGMYSNVTMSRHYVDATKLVRDATQSNVLLYALQHASPDPVLVLNLPDLYLPENQFDNYDYVHLFRQPNALPLAAVIRHGDDIPLNINNVVTGRITGFPGDDNVWKSYSEYTRDQIHAIVNARQIVLLARMSEGKLDFERFRTLGDELTTDDTYGRKPVEDLTGLDRLIMKIKRMTRPEVLEYLDSLEPKDKPGVVSVWNKAFPFEAPVSE